MLVKGATGEKTVQKGICIWSFQFVAFTVSGRNVVVWGAAVEKSICTSEDCLCATFRVQDQSTNMTSQSQRSHDVTDQLW